MTQRRWIRLMLLCVACLTGCSAGGPESPARLAPVGSAETLEVLYFDCGKADSMLLRQGGHAMLIDAATEKEGSRVLARLQEEGVERLDALVITHGDKDHVGGADHILRALDVERVYIGEVGKSSKQLEQFDKALGEKGLKAMTLAAGEHFAFGHAQMTVLGPIGAGEREENDASLVLRVAFGETAFLFTGDAERLSLTEMLAAPGARQNLSAQVLKVPHHGRAESVSAAFFQAVSPKIAVIPCERGTGDGLPDPATVYALEQAGAQVYVTGDGEVRVVSDGLRLTVTTRSPADLSTLPPGE